MRSLAAALAAVAAVAAAASGCGDEAEGQTVARFCDCCGDYFDSRQQCEEESARYDDGCGDNQTCREQVACISDAADCAAVGACAGLQCQGGSESEAE